MCLIFMPGPLLLLLMYCSSSFFFNIDVLLLRCRTLDGDASRPDEGGCPPQPLQVAIELVSQ